jgi:hypothetical protein
MKTARHFLRLAPAALLAAMALFATASVAQAQTFTVTNLSDSGVSGDGSLRGELASANADPAPDTIDFAAGLSGTITISKAGLQVKQPVDIEGPGPSVLTVAQSSKQRVIHIDLSSPGAVTIAGLHIANGAPASGPGGDILNDREVIAADLTIANSLITGGESTDYGGGFSSYGGPLTLRSTTVRGNHAVGGGGAWVGGENDPVTIEGSTFESNFGESGGGALIVEMQGSTGLISGSTFAGNESARQGGAISASITKVPLTIANSTIAGNISQEDGGGGLSLSADFPPILVADSTVVGNHANSSKGDGGGIEVPSPHEVRLEDTIVSGNTAGGAGPDLHGPMTGAFSLIGNPAGSTVTEVVPGSDLLGVDPLLGPLSSNGGPTATMALTATSPAVNRGSGGYTVDQRGSPRPVGFPGVPFSASPGANGADIGAFELQAPISPATAAKLRVRVKCPKGAQPDGCRFKLQAFTAKPAKGKRSKAKRPKPETALAKLKLKAGKSALVLLKPKPKYSTRLALAKKILVRYQVTIDGKTRTSYRKLKVVR